MYKNKKIVPNPDAYTKYCPEMSQWLYSLPLLIFNLCVRLCIIFTDSYTVLHFIMACVTDIVQKIRRAVCDRVQ